MNKGDELKLRFSNDVKHAIYRCEAKIKPLKEAMKILKGKDNSVARRTLKDKIEFLKIEIGDLGELEYNINRCDY